MFKVNNKTDVFIVEIWTYFTPCSSVHIVNFEYVIGGSEFPLLKQVLYCQCKRSGDCKESFKVSCFFNFLSSEYF